MEMEKSTKWGNKNLVLVYLIFTFQLFFGSPTTRLVSSRNFAPPRVQTLTSPFRVFVVCIPFLPVLWKSSNLQSSNLSSTCPPASPSALPFCLFALTFELSFWRWRRHWKCSRCCCCYCCCCYCCCYWCCWAWLLPFIYKTFIKFCVIKNGIYSRANTQWNINSME